MACTVWAWPARSSLDVNRSWPCWRNWRPRRVADQPQVVLIEGEAGMGKSSLVAKWVPTVSGAAVLRASGEEGESDLGYGVISQVASRRP